MPDRAEKTDLATWVKELPSTEKLSTYDAVLKYCAERYNNTPADLSFIMDSLTELFKRNMHQWVHENGMKTMAMPDPYEMKEMFDAQMAAGLLRMWVYASEYYQRWTGPELFKPISDDEISALFDKGEEHD